MIAILDSCVWRSSCLLGSGVGAAFSYWRTQKNVKLVLPEVVRLELEASYAESLIETIGKMRRGHSLLLASLRELKELILPSDEEVRGAIRRALDVVDDEICLDVETAKAALARVVEGRPPSANKSQQFKDCVLWGAVLGELEHDDVTFVSSDSDFQQNGQLHPVLRSEAGQRKHRLEFCSSLEGVVKGNLVKPRLKERVPIDDILPAHRGCAGQLEVTLTGPPRMDSLKCFATADPERLAFSYRVAFPSFDMSGRGRRDLSVILTGSGTLRSSDNSVLEVTPEASELEGYESDGARCRGSVVYAGMNAFVGHRTMRHDVKYEI